MRDTRPVLGRTETQAESDYWNEALYLLEELWLNDPPAFEEEAE